MGVIRKKITKKKTKKKVSKKKARRASTTFTPPPRPSINANVKTSIENDIEKEIRIQLGYPAAGVLPNDVIKAIKVASDSAIDKVAASNLNRVAQRVASGKIQSTVDFNKSIKDKLKVGLSGMQGMTASNDYTKMLAESAKMMKAKFDSLVAAGFTDDQAFSLVEAEIYAKGGTRKRG